MELHYFISKRTARVETTARIFERENACKLLFALQTIQKNAQYVWLEWSIDPVLNLS